MHSASYLELQLMAATKRAKADTATKKVTKLMRVQAEKPNLNKRDTKLMKVQAEKPNLKKK